MTEGEVIKYSAGGFRDFTRIAASDPTMWRDVFLNNREAVLEVLGRFNEDLSELQRAVRDGDGQTLFDLFTRTRAIRRSIVDIGQDSAAPNFGRDQQKKTSRAETQRSRPLQSGSTALGGERARLDSTAPARFRRRRCLHAMMACHASHLGRPAAGRTPSHA